MNDLPLPFVPEGCNLSDFAFMPLDVRRLLSSETWILGSGDERAAAMCLWLESWHQIPAASLPCDDRMLAHLAKCSRWPKVKEHSLRGWVKCSDGRLYHKVVAEKALEAWIEKLINSFSGASGNSKRWGVEIDVDGIRSQLIEAIHMLKSIAPQSKTLKKKSVITIAVQSPPDKQLSPPDSPPDSGWDRNRQGQGQGSIHLVKDGGESTIPEQEKSEDTKTSPPPPQGHFSNTKFPMHAEWEPSENFDSLCVSAGMRIGDDNAPVDQLYEFRTYWMTRPDVTQHQAGWEHKFIKNLMAEKARVKK